MNNHFGIKKKLNVQVEVKCSIIFSSKFPIFEPTGLTKFFRRPSILSILPMMRAADEPELFGGIIVGDAMGGPNVPVGRNDGGAAVVVAVARQLAQVRHRAVILSTPVHDTHRMGS